MKRIVLLVVGLLLAGSLSVMAAGGGEEETAVKPGERKVLEYEVISEITKDRVASEDHPGAEVRRLKEEIVLDRFGIKEVAQMIPSGTYMEKINLLFATGEAPHLVSIGDADTKRFAMEGHLVAMSDHLDKVPDYINLYEPEIWELAYAIAKNADGKLYRLPTKNFRVESKAWIWRKGTFDKMGLIFPDTTEELYQVLKKIKAEHPESIPIPSRWGVGHFMAGHLIAHRTGSSWLVDPDTKVLEFGPTTEKYRDLMKYMNKLYREKMVEPEFPTVTNAQWTEKYAKGLTYIQYSYGGRAAWANRTMVVDPDANWQWSKVWPRAYPEKEMLTTREKPITGGGLVLTTRNDAEHIDRYLEYYNWMSTIEGQIFCNFGIEGKTFNYVDGNPVLADFLQSEKNPQGEPHWQWGLESCPAYWLREYAIQAGFGRAELAVSDVVLEHPYIPMIVWQLTKDQEKDLVDLETVINDVRDEYIIKFAMGKRDPSDDSNWNEFQDALKKAGLDKALAIRKEAFKKSFYK